MFRVLAIAILTTGLTLLPALATAGRDYTFVDLDYINTTIDVGPFNVDGDGIGVSGSWAFADQFHLFGGVSLQDFDPGVDISQFGAGVGFNTELNESIDFVGSFALLHASVDGGGDESGFELGAGIRSQVGQRVQLDGGITYVDLGGDDLVVSGTARYFFTDAFAGSLGLAIADDVLTLRLGVRWELGR